MQTDRDAVFAALADPMRRETLELLRSGPQPVGKLAEQLPISRPALSQHLRRLSEAGLVHSTAEGTRRIYALRPEGLGVLREWLDVMWRDALAQFAQAVDSDSARPSGARDRKDST